jgi:hypothetical protein
MRNTTKGYLKQQEKAKQDAQAKQTEQQEPPMMAASEETENVAMSGDAHTEEPIQPVPEEPMESTAVATDSEVFPATAEAQPSIEVHLTLLIKPFSRKTNFHFLGHRQRSH